MKIYFRRYAKDLIKDTIQRNASPVRYEQGGEKSGIGGSSSSLNSSASDESNRLQQQQQHTSRLRSTLLHSLSTNDASIGEYKYTVTVGNQSIKVTGSNLDLVKVIMQPHCKIELLQYVLKDRFFMPVTIISRHILVTRHRHEK